MNSDIALLILIDYKNQDYVDVLHDVDGVLDSLGERELERQLSILKRGGTLVSLRAMPNGEFAQRMGMPGFKRFLFGMAGCKFDKMAQKRDQRYRFVFVHEDGLGLAVLPEILGERKIEASVDEVFALDGVNNALAKVAAGGSKGKTVLRIAHS